MGPRTEAFEAAFAERLGCRHAVALSSCTAALHLAYLAAGVGPGDEVIVPAFTFVATAAAAVYCGATPVFADLIGAEEPSIDPEDVERRITDRTRAVCAVHYGGYAAPVDRLRELCDARGLALVEDAAHAPSAELGGRPLGTFGLAGAFSFFSNKVLSAGEGGLLATDDDDVAARAKLLRCQGMTSGTWDRHRGRSDAYDVVETGFNMRMDEPRAALLLSRLARLDADVARRRELTRRYRERLAGVDGVLVPFADAQVDDSSCYVMPVMVDAARRDAVRIGLRERHGVQTSVLYPATHRFTAYRERARDVVLPRTEDAAAREITLPLYPHLGDDGQDRVCDALAAEL
jgi:dTDP-4-amino-4,6-dideoxygalactose transaminase